MFRNYILTAVRYFLRNKTTTFINVVGLSIGISAALIIFLLVNYSYSFDRFEPDRNRIFRVVADKDGRKTPGIPVPFAEAIKQALGSPKMVAPLFDCVGNVNIPGDAEHPDRLFKQQEQLVFTDQGYFNLIPHQWLAGRAATALEAPYRLVLTESRAKIYFPGVPIDQLIGKTVIFSDSLSMTIAGVVADLKDNTDFAFQCFISLNTIYSTALQKDYQTNEWGNISSGNQVLVKLAPGVRPATVDRVMASIFQAHLTDPADSKVVHRLQPLADVHTNPEFGGTVNPVVLRNLSLLAIFLLTLAVINFVNLSTAQASERAREIGIRKTLGSAKWQLITQFLSETFLLTTVSASLSVALIPILLTVFGSFVPAGLNVSSLLGEPAVWLFLLALTVVVSLTAGLYPAFMLTRFRPVLVLKNVNVGHSGSTRSMWLRKTLIVFQFIVAQVFVIGVVVVDKQLHYVQTKDMGFSKDAIINFRLPFEASALSDKRLLLKRELSTVPEIRAISLASQAPALAGTMSTQVSFTDQGKNIKLNVSLRSGDTAFLQVYHISLVSGRNLAYADTANELLINETLARQLGFSHPGDAVGHSLVFGEHPMPVVGVMHDFQQASVRSTIVPMIYFSAVKQAYVMHIALQHDPASWQKTLAKAAAIWKSIYPEVAFEYHFFDKQIEDFYKQERQLSMLLTWAAGVAILISCMGVLGLVIFTTNRRVKEIGIRKVLGATVAQIVALLTGDLARLLVIAFIIAVPIAWWQAHQWMQNFAYHTKLRWWLFLVGGVLMITIALIVVGLRAGKVALANPVKSLRTE